MDIRIEPGLLRGSVMPPASKSVAHRVILAQALAGQAIPPAREGDSQDMEATRRCVAALRAATPGQLPRLDCGESGSTLRFFIPVALAVAGGGLFTGSARLMERPQQPYFDIFDAQGIAHAYEGGSLRVEGTLRSGEFPLPGNVSSQFVTGLLYALPLLPGDSSIVMTSPLESRGYVDLTLATLHRFGIQVDTQDYTEFFIPGGQHFLPRDAAVEADWSQAGFWYAAQLLGSEVTVEGLDPHSAQGDRVVEDLARRLRQPGDMEIDVSDCPDLLPPLAVMAAVRSGTTAFVNAARLRIKESDRLTTTCRLLTALGGQAREGADSLTVCGQPYLTGGTVDGANDHRIVMAAAIAATACRTPVTILGAEAVRKSYPRFWEDYTRLGGKTHVL